MIEIIKGFAAAVLIPAIRPAAGWLVNALKDNKITRMEWREGISKTVKVMVISIAAYYSLSFAGLDVSIVATGFGAIIADKLLDAIKENKSVKR
ncbi:hypothetical protein LCGC14_2127050 [marine sediment metagenome]|uniref:Holin n=1 Tax=marine sediment metagenome TaxID=412755 RepID=A0A0F9E2H8_9ZZZZ